MVSNTITIKSAKRPGQRYPFYPPTEIIPGECEILWEDEHGNKTTRLIRYVSGMKSIFVDEWSEKEREIKPKKIKLTNGFKQIDKRDANLYNFIIYSGYNKANTETKLPDTAALYEVLDYEQKAREAVEKESKIIEAENFVANGNIEDVRAYALALCKTKAEAESIARESEFTIRHKMMFVAKKNPDTFVSGFQSKALKNKIIIHKALQEGVIKLTTDSKSMYFANSESEFVTAPSGMSVIEWFADLALKNEDHADNLEKIKMAISKPSDAEEKNVPWEKQILNKAIDSGKVVKTNNWYAVPDPEDDENPLMKFNGVKAIVKAITTNQDNILSYLV
jgi:hypothetical protein